MLRFLEAVEETIVQEPQYSLAEVILWYSLLAFSIILLVIYLIVRGRRNNNGLVTIQNAIQKELKMIVSKKEAVINGQKVDLHLYGTAKKLNVFLSEFVTIREQTSLPDADAIIGKTQKIIKAVHSTNVDKMTKEEKIKYLDKTIDRLTFIYGKLDVIRMLVK